MNRNSAALSCVSSFSFNARLRARAGFSTFRSTTSSLSSRAAKGFELEGVEVSSSSDSESLTDFAFSSFSGFFSANFSGFSSFSSFF